MKNDILKVMKVLYTMIDDNRQKLEEEAVMLQDEPEADEVIIDGYTQAEVLGMQLLADLKLQDSMLHWINSNNLQNLTVQQRKDLFGLLSQFKMESEVIH